jgi:RND family efflux transporter MFP subunit
MGYGSFFAISLSRREERPPASRRTTIWTLTVPTCHAKISPGLRRWPKMLRRILDRDAKPMEEPNRNGSLFILALLLTAAGSGLRCSDGKRSGGQPSPATGEAAVPQLSDGDLAAQDETRGHVGAIVARETVDIAAEYGGLLMAVNVQLGDRVQKDQLIATLDAKSFEHALAAAKAGLLAAHASTKEAELKLQAAKDRYHRRSSAAGTYSEEDLATALSNQKLAGVQKTTASAQVAQEAANILMLREKLSGAAIRAPFEGKVAAIYNQPGSNLKPGQPIVRLITADDMWVRFAIPREKVAAMTRGTNVRVVVENVTHPLVAQVMHVAPEVEPASQMVFVEGRLEGLSGGRPAHLQIGSMARVFLDSKTQSRPQRSQ